MSDALALLAEHEAAHRDALSRTLSEYGAEWGAIAALAARALEKKLPLLFCGNGGSACDAMHIAGEFVGRFVSDRVALPAIALSADSGILTAVGNDYGFDQVFARQVAAYGREGALLFALSTSGTSPNVVRALAQAKVSGLTTVLLTGERGRNATVAADHRIVVPSQTTARIQEAHIFLLHTLAALIEQEMGF
jgi:D-sedoheptulose 7-phosphate isomerase